MLPKIGLTPPNSRSLNADMPDRSNILSEYSAIKEQRKVKRPSFINNIAGAGVDAMSNMRSIGDRVPTPPDVAKYNKMTMADFDQMRHEQGFDAVSDYVRTMEHKRLTGGK